MSGIKWELKKEENILRKHIIISLKRYNNKLLFLGEYNSFLIEFVNKKNDIKENLNEMENNKNDIKEDNNNKENEGNYSN